MRADYLVGCDGAASLVRRTSASRSPARARIGYPLNLFFRAPDLLEQIGHKPGTFFIPVDRGGVWGNLRIIDPARGLWRLMVDQAGDEVTPENVDRAGYLRRALGRDVEVEWVDVNVWRRRSLVAERYGEGRVFIAGDAVHQLSPTGALGMNSGVADAVDLGWKLAAVLQGWGGARLIASYDAERRPVGERNVAMATSFYQHNEAFSHWSPQLEEDGAEGERARREFGDMLESKIGGEFRTLGLQIGYAYENSPICVADGTPPPPDDPANYVANARPGARAPHVWLKDGSSTLDLFGRGFVLLRFAGAPEPAALLHAAAARGVPLTVADIDRAEAAAIYQRRLVLVRPDGHVAWRADDTAGRRRRLIDRVRGRLIRPQPAWMTGAGRRRPGPLGRGKPDQRALQVVAAPVGQQLRRLLVLHPFGDGLEPEPAREIDQRLHEGAVVLRLACRFCTKAPSILTMSTPSLRRLRNEVWPAPKSSMAMRQPRSLTRVTKPRVSSTSWMAAVSVISMISRSATLGIGAQQRAEAEPPVRIDGRGRRDIDAGLEVRAPRPIRRPPVRARGGRACAPARAARRPGRSRARGRRGRPARLIRIRHS